MSRSANEGTPARNAVRAVGAAAIATIATGFGVFAFGELRLTGLAWGVNGLTQTDAWNLESPAAVFVAIAYLLIAATLLAVSVRMCLRAPRRELRGLAIGLSVSSSLIILIGGALALAPAPFWK